MNPLERRLRTVRRLAWACALLVLVITSLSAAIRLTRAGLGCAPWPQCRVAHAQLAPQALDALESQGAAAARIAHRFAASAALLLVIALLMKTWAQQPPLRAQGQLVLALLALALFLAVLGRLAGASRAPPVVLGNLLAGFALFALSCRLVQASGPATGARPGLRPWTLAALVLLLLQIALGGLVSADAAGAGCDAGGACTVHVAGAFVLAALLLALAWAAWRGGARRSAATLALLLIAQGGLGLRLAAGDPPLALALAHNLGAALLLAALLALLPVPRR